MVLCCLGWGRPSVIYVCTCPSISVGIVILFLVWMWSMVIRLWSLLLCRHIIRSVLRIFVVVIRHVSVTTWSVPHGHAQCHRVGTNVENMTGNIRVVSKDGLETGANNKQAFGRQDVLLNIFYPINRDPKVWWLKYKDVTCSSIWIRLITMIINDSHTIV